MKLSLIIEKFEELAPLSLAMEWDNVGLMAGDCQSDIKKAVVVLDVTDKVIDFAVENGCGLIVSHHPFIMSLPKNMAYDTSLNKMVYKLIKNDIAVYSMHTNFDSCIGGVNDVICEKLDIKPACDAPEIIRYGEIKEQTLADFIKKVKEAFNVKAALYSGNLNEKIKKIAVCGGSGGSFLEMAKKEYNADVYFTGELKYHDFQHAQELGIAVVTAGHYETEAPSLHKVSDILTGLGIDVLKTDIFNGFSQIFS